MRTRWLAKAEAEHSRGVTLPETDDARARRRS